MPTRLPPAGSRCLPFATPAGRRGFAWGRIGGGSGQCAGVGLLRPWTMRRLPAALNPNVSAGIRADEHAASPSRMRGIQWRSSACARHAAKRRCVALLARRVRLPLRGSTGWLDCGAGRLPVSRLTARTGAARAHKTRASVGGGAGSVKAERAAGVRDDCRAWPEAVRGGSRGESLCYRSAAFGARMRIPRVQLNGKQEADPARPVLSPQRYAARATRFPAHALGRPRCHCPSAGREGCGLASGQPGYRPTQGAARRSPNARSAGTDEVRIPPASARASFDPSWLTCPLAAAVPPACPFPL